MIFEGELVMADSENSSELIDEIANTFNSTSTVLPDPSFSIIVAAYVVLTTIAVLGNMSVIMVMALQKNMWTTRNIFILLLAISDLMSACSIPLTVTDGLSRSWIIGDSQLVCRLVKTVPNLAVFMSSFTIVAIALDRYHVICHPTKPQITNVEAWLILPTTFVLAAASTSILFFKSRLYSLERLLMNQGIGIPQRHKQFLSSVLICVEDWNDGKPMQKEDRLYYTVFSFTVQFLLPLVVIVIVYTKIYSYLKEHQYSMTVQRNRMKRTSVIFFLISVIFCLSWLPFCLFCVLSEAIDLFPHAEDMMLAYCITHLIGMSSSCSNPVLYAFFNTNFSKEFKRIPVEIRKLLRLPLKRNSSGRSCDMTNITNCRMGSGLLHSCSELNSPSRRIKEMRMKPIPTLSRVENLAARSFVLESSL